MLSVCVCMCMGVWVRVCVHSYQAIFGVSFGVRITGICAHTANTKALSLLFAWFHKVMLKRAEHFEKLTTAFVNM